MRIEYLSATGELRKAYIGKSNPEFTRLTAFPTGTSDLIRLRWDEGQRTWREQREYEYRQTYSVRMYAELKACAERDAWRVLDAGADAEGVTLIERGQSWRTGDAFPGVQVLTVWGLT